MSSKENKREYESMRQRRRAKQKASAGQGQQAEIYCMNVNIKMNGVTEMRLAWPTVAKVQMLLATKEYHLAKKEIDLYSEEVADIEARCRAARELLDWEDYHDTPLADIFNEDDKLQSRVISVLEKSNITTIGELSLCSPDDLIAIRGIGEKGLVCVLEYVARSRAEFVGTLREGESIQFILSDPIAPEADFGYRDPSCTDADSPWDS